MAAPKGNNWGNKYNVGVHTVIVDAVRKGNSKSVAFRLAGLHPDSVFAWLRLGREQAEQYPHYAQLQEDIENALAEFEAERVAAITQAADTGTWQAAAWWLERRNPQEWGKKDHVKVEQERPTLQLNQVIITEPGAIESSRELIRHLTSGRPAITQHAGDDSALTED